MSAEEAVVTMKRSFGGIVSNFKKDYENDYERQLGQKHLKAYLRGWRGFTYGRDAKGRPQYHKTKEIWTKDEQG